MKETDTYRKVFMRTDCDCMVASLAMLLQCSYEAAAQFFPAIAIKKKGYNWEYLTPFLKANGIYLTWLPSKNEVNWNKPAMLDVPSLTAPDKGDHIVFWDGTRVIDPSNKEVKYTEVPEEINCAYQISENWTKLPLSIEPESEGQSKLDLKELAKRLDEALSKETRESMNEFLNSIGGYKWIQPVITDQPKETADQPVVKKNLTTETGRANYTDFGKQTQDALPQETYTDFYDIRKSTERHLGTVPADQSSANYMHVTPATFDDYMKMDKGEIINMLLECHRIMDIQRGLTGETVNNVPTFTTTSATADQPQPTKRTAEEIFDSVFEDDHCYHFPQLKLLVKLCMEEYRREGVPTDEEIVTWAKTVDVENEDDMSPFKYMVFAAKWCRDKLNLK